MFKLKFNSYVLIGNPNRLKFVALYNFLWYLVNSSLLGPDLIVLERLIVFSVSVVKVKCVFSVSFSVTLIGGVVFLLFAITALFFDPNEK